MSNRRFHTVDVFATERYAGNQLAVFHEADAYSTDENLALTRETNYSEATFIEGDPLDDPVTVRIFDPAEEIPFAGHPTLGTAAVIREFVRDDHPDELVLSLGVGDVPVWVETADDGIERYWMRQITPAFGDEILDGHGDGIENGSGDGTDGDPSQPDRRATELDRAAAARVLGLDRDDVLADAPLQLVSTGLPTLVVPLASLDAAERAATQPDAYQRELIDVVGGCNLLVVTDETVADDADLHVRVFADWADVPEDPATGSSNGCLAAYLARYDDAARRLGLDVPDAGRSPAGEDAVDVVVEQGIEMGRPSRLHLRARETSPATDSEGDVDGVDRGKGEIDVRVGGRVIPVAEGRLL
jgi:trans-2,3-dihydro-3-hydroxyanthranilate isomerase